jgi:DNA-binding CsgD family transcriptional regulator
MSLLKPRVDLLQILEAAYGVEPDEERWLRALIAELNSAIEPALASGVAAIAHHDDYADAALLVNVSTDRTFEAFGAELSAGLPAAGPNGIRALYYPGRPFSTHRELAKRSPPELRAFQEFARRGAPDAFAFFAYPAPGVAAAFWSTLEVAPRYGKGERGVLGRLAAHLDSAFRLRVSPQAVVAGVLSPAGKLLDLEHSALAGSSELLATRVVSIERSRLRAKRHSPDALDDWRALIDGQYSIVPREDADGRRHYLLISNSPLAREHARLNAREVDVLTFAARGLTGKNTAYALGVSEPSVSGILARAATKLGLRSRAELIKVAAALFGVSSGSIATSKLSPAEREVLDLLRRGLSNAQIAALRSRSGNTVANQIASILRKTEAPSRRTLSRSPLRGDD